MTYIERILALKQRTDFELLSRSVEIDNLLSSISPEVKALVTELADIHTEQLVRAEDNAVRSHRRQILAAIEGTTWVSEAGSTGRDENDISLVQVLNQAELAS